MSLAPFKYWRQFGGILAFAFVVCMVGSGEESLWIQTAHAQDVTQSIWTSFSAVLGVVIAFLQFVSFMAFHLLEVLMDPEIIFDLGIVGDGSGNATGQDILQSIWQVSRDIVNIIFAFLLIIGAVITVITAKNEIISQYYKKFILAVVLVNFSWFFPRVILDVANVLTATVYQLPSLMQNLECKVIVKGKQEDCEGILNVVYFVTIDDIKALDTGVAEDSNPSLYTCPLGGDFSKNPTGKKILCYRSGKLDNSASAKNILNGLVINHARLPSLAKIISPSPGPGAAGAPLNSQGVVMIMTFVIQSMLILLIHIMLFFPLAAMLVIMLIRIPILWVTIAFMPFMFVGFVIGEKGGFDTMKEIFHRFLTAAFIPVAAAIPLSVGFIMINAGLRIVPPASSTAARLTSINGVLFSNVDSMWTMLWLLLTLFVIWKGFFMALKIDEMYDGIGNYFQGIGKSWGSFALKAPLALPFIPVAGGTSPLQILGGAANIAKNPNVLITDDKQIDSNDLKRLLFGQSPGSKDGPKDKAVQDAVTNVRTDNNIKIDAKINRIQNAGNETELKNAVQDFEADIQKHGGGKLTKQQIKEAMKELAPALSTVLDEKIEPNLKTTA